MDFISKVYLISVLATVAVPCVVLFLMAYAIICCVF